MITRAALPLLVLALTGCNAKPEPRPIPAVAQERQCPGFPLPPEELLKRPVKPTWGPWADFIAKGIQYREWRPFLDVVDFSYWNLELRD